MVKGHPTLPAIVHLFFEIYSLTRTVNELLEYKRLKSNFLFDTVVENRTKKSHFLKVRMPPPRI